MLKTFKFSWVLLTFFVNFSSNYMSSIFPSQFHSSSSTTNSNIPQVNPEISQEISHLMGSFLDDINNLTSEESAFIKEEIHLYFTKNKKQFNEFLNSKLIQNQRNYLEKAIDGNKDAQKAINESTNLVEDQDQNKFFLTLLKFLMANRGKSMDITSLIATNNDDFFNFFIKKIGPVKKIFEKINGLASFPMVQNKQVRSIMNLFFVKKRDQWVFSVEKSMNLLDGLLKKILSEPSINGLFNFFLQDDAVVDAVNYWTDKIMAGEKVKLNDELNKQNSPIKIVYDKALNIIAKTNPQLSEKVKNLLEKIFHDKPLKIQESLFDIFTSLNIPLFEKFRKIEENFNSLEKIMKSFGNGNNNLKVIIPQLISKDGLLLGENGIVTNFKEIFAEIQITGSSLSMENSSNEVISLLNYDKKKIIKIQKFLKNNSKFIEDIKKEIKNQNNNQTKFLKDFITKSKKDSKQIKEDFKSLISHMENFNGTIKNLNDNLGPNVWENFLKNTHQEAEDFLKTLSLEKQENIRYLLSELQVASEDFDYKKQDILEPVLKSATTTKNLTKKFVIPVLLTGGLSTTGLIILSQQNNTAKKNEITVVK
jgi:hypothetical protein